MMAVETTNLTTAFKAFEGNPHSGSELIDRVYAEAREALDRLPVPTRRTEAWKYTPVNKISKYDWQPVQEHYVLDRKALDLPDLDAHLVWVIDGQVMIEEADLPQGVTLLSMSEAKESESNHFEAIYGQLADHRKDLFVALNTAYASGGVYLHLAKHVSMTKPVHVVHVYTQADTAVMTRNIIIAEQGSQGHMTHSFHHTDGPIHSNVVTEIKVADNAQFTLDKLQSGLEDSYHFSSEEVHLGRDSVATINTITIDGAWTRNEPHVRFHGEGSVCHLNGSYFPSAAEHIDNHSIIDHLVPHCVSHELYKGVIYDQGKGVFNGKVFVRPDAQKTNAYQQNANILMSTQGSINSKPELEIYADDVKCSHGSTTGQLDMDALFYLQCRGLNYAAAKQMLVNAFVGEVIERLDAPLQDYVWRRMEEKIGGISDS